MLTRSFVLAVLVSLALGAPSSATEPGTPMDCSDLELAPGLTCTKEPLEPNPRFFLNSSLVVDNDGRLVNSLEQVLEEVGTCGRASIRRNLFLRAREGDVWTPLIVAQNRCVDPAITHFEFIGVLGIRFDAPRGSLFVQFRSGCFNDLVGPSCVPGELWLARIDGFTPLADVLPAPPLPLPLCSNGLDDDGDGRIDAADDHCKSAADNDESRP